MTASSQLNTVQTRADNQSARVFVREICKPSYDGIWPSNFYLTARCVQFYGETEGIV